MGTRVVVEIDGAHIKNVDDFYDEISEKLIPGDKWGRNLDAFNDILRGGFGTPEGGFVLRWRNADLSRSALGTVFDTIVEIIEFHRDDTTDWGGGPVELKLD